MEKSQITAVTSGLWELPQSGTSVSRDVAYRPRMRKSLFAVGLAVIMGLEALILLSPELPETSRLGVNVPLRSTEILEKCHLLNAKPGPPPDFNQRKESDRFVPGTRPTLIKNATLWTGRVEGLEVLHGDILLDKGLIKAVGVIDHTILEEVGIVHTVNVHGSWVTPGIIDMHSHLGVDASPALRGSSDTNSLKGPILPWLRALDALNTHDDAYKLSISGGVTTALGLPGSANAIGGQGVVFKLRPTVERSPTSMLLENPWSLNETEYNSTIAIRWRQMKHACGENPDRVYGNTRMDTAWAFRKAYDTARKIKEDQDAYCAKALVGEWRGLSPEFPEDLQWEALVDVLRGRVKVHTHCYEAIDLDDLVRVTNEFKFPIAAFHHAHETYLVPDTLKSAYGHPPAVALFATNARYKREAYRGSEFAPRILAENGIQVVMKSDHPVLNSRFLLYEAQQAHHFGLDHNLALLAVTGTPAQVLGQDHRIGFIKKGYDADIVLWDSHPLALGATPKQVWIDGIAQIESPFSHSKSNSHQRLPKQPKYDKEADDTVKYDGLPPLLPKKSEGVVVFTNVSEILNKDGFRIFTSFAATNTENKGIAVAQNGKVLCAGMLSSCSDLVPHRAHYVDLEGGSITPGLTSFGSALGLQEIQGEASTIDGYTISPLLQDSPKIVDGLLIHAADGLQFTTRDSLLAYRSGVTTGIVAPRAQVFLSGLSTVFSTGGLHQLERGAVIQDIAALHVSISHLGTPSVSTQIATLRRLLLDKSKGPVGAWFAKAASGDIPLVISVGNADIIATLIRLKYEVEEAIHSSLRIVLAGAEEAHLLAKEISKANIGVIVAPSRPYPHTWESRRILPGPPLTKTNTISVLLEHNITVAIGVSGAWQARNTRFDAAWAALESGGEIRKTDALALVSTNLEKLLGVKDGEDGDLVATRGGGLLSFESKVVAVISGRRDAIDLFE